MSLLSGLGARRGERAAAKVLNDVWVRRLARAGLVSRAAVYLVFTLLVGLILLGRGDHEVDKRGALTAVAAEPFGRVLLLLLCVGFVGYIAWQLLRAASPSHAGGGRGAHRAARGDREEALAIGKRLVAAGTAVVYVAFLVTTLRVIVGSDDSSSSGQQDVTARVLGAPGGRVAVAIAGLVVAGIGVGLFVFAASRKFEGPLDTSAMSAAMRRAAGIIGVAGQSGRGLVFAIIGGFIVSAAAADDAGKSKGLDASLHTLAGQRFGAVMLAVVALGFCAFGLYSLIDARYRDDFTI